jgi:amino acid transporter
MSAVDGTGAPPGDVSYTPLSRTIGWRQAFVMGLAGVILVTGITPFAVQAMGAAAIPLLVGIQVIGLVVCLCVGEMAALWPHRTGGTPSYAAECFKPLGPKAALHIGGLSTWSYWLGWFPVAPINMILAANYIAVLFHVPLGSIVDPAGSLGTPEGIGVLAITLVGLVILFVPCYLGVRLGARFAALLGVVSMVPLTLLIILPLFKPSTFHWANVAGFHFSNAKVAGFAFVMSWLFVISWNGIGVESAGCYVAECRDPHRDAKIALTAEGLYGLFIYAGTAIVFVAVLGSSLTSADPLTEYTTYAARIFGTGSWVKYAIGIPLIAALLLSVLNAIMGVGRSLYQASEDRLLPKFFTHQNSHHAPDRAMLFNLVCALLVGLLGSPVRIYIFSNVGYLFAIVVALFGYFFVRQFRKDLRSPFRLPGVFRWIALAMGAFLTFVYIAGGWGSPDIVVGSGQGPLLFILGLVVVGAYVPLYLWRRRTDRLDGLPPLVALPDVAELAAAQAIRDGTQEAAPVSVGAHVDGAGMEAGRIIDAPDEAPATG